MFSKSAIWVVVLLLLFMLFKQFDSHGSSGGSKSIAYSDLLDEVKAKRVKDVVIEGSSITAKMMDDTKVRTTATMLDKGLIGDLRDNGVHFDVRPPEEVSFLQQIFMNWFPMLLLIGVWIFFMRQMQGGGKGGAFSFGKSKARMMDEASNTVTFADVAGCDEAKEEVNEVVDFLKDPSKFQKLGGRIPRGVLMVGPPGTGKTLLARAVAGEAKVPFFSLSGSEFVEMFVGVGAARVRDLFAQAEAKAPCIVFIDELDAIGKVRMQSPMGSHEEREQTLNQLLAEMDGFDGRKGIIIMGATNHPEVLDPALLRPGRFDRQVLVDKPDVRGREDILRIHVKTVKIAEHVDLRVLAQRTAGCAGADLANLVNEAALLAARKNKTAVEMKDFDDAIDRIIAGLEKKRVMSDKERRIVAYHESGHAIVASVLPGLDPVHKLSIVARGFGALGYTMQLPLEDCYLMTRQDLQGQLAVLLGGRSAEEIAFGEVSTGAQNDLQRATDIARAMVTEFGMSDALGAVNYDGHRGNKFLDMPFMNERGNHSEETARLIDIEVKQILSDAHDEARRVLRERTEILAELSRRLLIKEVIEGEELRELLGPIPPKDPDGTVPLALPAEGVRTE